MNLEAKNHSLVLPLPRKATRGKSGEADLGAGGFMKIGALAKVAGVTVRTTSEGETCQLQRCTIWERSGGATIRTTPEVAVLR